MTLEKSIDSFEVSNGESCGQQQQLQKPFQSQQQQHLKFDCITTKQDCSLHADSHTSNGFPTFNQEKDLKDNGAEIKADDQTSPTGGEFKEIGIVGPGIDITEEKSEFVNSKPVVNHTDSTGSMVKLTKTKDKEAQSPFLEAPATDGSVAIKIDKKSTLPLHLVFKDLTVTVSTEGGEREILKNVSGEVKPGEVLAIMGPSGAGKTTLLNILAGRLARTGGEITGGAVTINKAKITKRVRRRIGYVLQDDVFFSNLTLRQTLQFAAELRLPDSISKHEKIEKLDELIQKLDLKKCENTVIGGSIFVARGVSGGERKRASIGVELITNPSLLLMDEPTSGLDSSTAYSLVNLLKSMAAKENRTIVCTIHQPSSQIFHLFDKLILLCNGKVAYYGETAGVMNFFNDIGLPCYPNWNPADFIMEMMKAGDEIESKVVREFLKRYPYVSEPFSDSKKVTPKMSHKPVELHAISDDPEKTKVVEKMSNGTANGDVSGLDDKNVVISMQTEAVEFSGKKCFEDRSSSPVDDEDEIKTPKWPASFKTQLKVLTHRTFIQTKANIWDKLNFIQTITLAVIVGLIWFQAPYREESIRDRTGILFFMAVYWGFTPMFQSLVAFPDERPVINKERAAGMYRLSAYYISKCVSELPLVILQPFIFHAIVYWMTGLNRSAWYLVSLLCLLVSCLTAQSVGLLIGASVLGFKKALLVASVLMLSFMLLGGYYNQNIPFWLDWVKYVSFISYSFSSLMQADLLDSASYTCASSSSRYISCRNNATMVTGTEILEGMNLSLSLGMNVLVLIFYGLIFRTLTYLSLRYMNKPK